MLDIFCNVFTNDGTNHPYAIRQPKERCSKYLLNCRKLNPRNLFMNSTDVNEIKHILMSLQPTTCSDYDNFTLAS